MCHPIPVRICIRESPFQLPCDARFDATAAFNIELQTDVRHSVLIRLIEVGFTQSAEEHFSAQRNYYGLGRRQRFFAESFGAKKFMFLRGWGGRGQKLILGIPPMGALVKKCGAQGFKLIHKLLAGEFDGG